MNPPVDLVTKASSKIKEESSESVSLVEKELSTFCRPVKQELLKYQLPPCECPEDVLTVQTFVLSAVKKKDEKSLTLEVERVKREQQRMWAEAPSYHDNDSKSLEGYRAVIQQLQRRTEPAMLYRVLLSLAHGESLSIVASHPKFHPHLINAIFRMDPFTKPKAIQKHMEGDEDHFATFKIADAHLHLCLALVSANGTFATPMIDSLVKFMASIPGDMMDPAVSEKSYRVHACINRLRKILPGTSGHDKFTAALDSKFPYKSAKQERITAYVTELIRILDYAPDMLDSVFHMCISKALELDVEIRIHDGGNATVEKAEKSVEEEHGVFSFEDDSKLNDITKDEQMLTEEDQHVVKKKEAADEMADKLDAIMVQVFQHLEKSCTTPAKIMEMYGVAHRTFSSVVLTTYKSKFVQFVLFYLCGRFHEVTSTEVLDKYDIDPLDRHFASALLEIILDGRQAVILRQISACYLASFVSRATFIDDQTVCETLAALLQWTELYISQLSTTSFRRTLSSTKTSAKGAAHDDGRDHAVFYTVCQAAFYIMCFRGQDAWNHYQSVVSCNIMDEDDEDYVDPHTMDIGARRWQSILCSPRSRHLKPLQYCLESVRREFLRLAGALALLPEAFLTQQNKDDASKRDIQTAKLLKNTAIPIRKRRKATSIMTPALMQYSKTTNTSGGVGGMGEGSNPLDSFFPFDPYLLRRSHVFIEKYYRSWDGSSEDDDEDARLREEGELVSDDKEDDSSVSDSSDDDDDGDQSEKENDEVDETSIDGATPMSLGSTDGGGALMSPHQNNMMLDCGDEKQHRKSSIASDGSW